MPALRVLIADDDPVVRDVLGELIDAQPDLEVAGRAGDGESALHVAAETRPDVVLLDVRMPGGGGPMVAQQLREALPDARIVGLSAYEDQVTVRAMLRAGASTYVIKGTSNAELLESVRTAGERPEPAPAPAPAPETPADERCDPVRVLVAEQDPQRLDALAEVVSTDTGLELVGVAQTPHHAVTLAAGTQPDVALLDPRMPAGGGVRAAHEIRSVSPRTRIVALSEGPGAAHVVAMLRAGATSYLVEGSPEARVRETIHRTARGEAAMPEEVAGTVARELFVELDERAQLNDRRRRSETAIRRILTPEGRRHDLEMVFQPVMDLQGGQTVGYEALARFDFEPRQAPDVWFREAAGVGLGVDLELAAVERALESLNALSPDAWLSLNLSPAAAMSPECTDILAPVAGRVVLEMTEHAPVDDYDEIKEALAPLRGLGARLAVDDAGAGFASLRHIVLLQPEYIKLDITLTRGIADDPARRAMARALISFGAETGKRVIAEGVETAEELEALRSLGVPLGQGHHLARPGPMRDNGRPPPRSP